MTPPLPPPGIENVKIQENSEKIRGPPEVPWISEFSRIFTFSTLTGGGGGVIRSYTRKVGELHRSLWSAQKGCNIVRISKKCSHILLYFHLGKKLRGCSSSKVHFHFLDCLLFVLQIKLEGWNFLWELVLFQIICTAGFYDAPLAIRALRARKAV